MTVAYLRGLLKPVGRTANDSMREDIVLEALYMEECAKGLEDMSRISAAIYSGANLKSENRKKLHNQLLDNMDDARLLHSFNFPEYKARTSELSPDQVYAAIAAVGILKKKS